MQVHNAWHELCGDELLPQLMSAADWTRWVLEERRLAEAQSEEMMLNDKVCPSLCSILPFEKKPFTTRADLPPPEFSLHLKKSRKQGRGRQLCHWRS